MDSTFSNTYGPDGELISSVRILMPEERTSIESVVAEQQKQIDALTDIVLGGNT